jgi:hypothetical protein
VQPRMPAPGGGTTLSATLFLATITSTSIQSCVTRYEDEARKKNKCVFPLLRRPTTEPFPPLFPAGARPHPPPLAARASAGTRPL